MILLMKKLNKEFLDNRTKPKLKTAIDRLSKFLLDKDDRGLKQARELRSPFYFFN